MIRRAGIGILCEKVGDGSMRIMIQGGRSIHLFIFCSIKVPVSIAGRKADVLSQNGFPDQYLSRPKLSTLGVCNGKWHHPVQHARDSNPQRYREKNPGCAVDRRLMYLTTKEKKKEKYGVTSSPSPPQNASLRNQKILTNLGCLSAEATKPTATGLLLAAVVAVAAAAYRVWGTRGWCSDSPIPRSCLAQRSASQFPSADLRR